MSHLGPELHDLVDGRLTPAQAEVALGHVARCADCAAELAAVRRARLALAGGIPPAPQELTARLIALGTLPPAPRAAGSLSVPLPGTRTVVPVAGLGSGGQHRRPWIALPVAAAAVLITLVALGEPRSILPVDHRAEALASLGAVRPVAVATTAGDQVLGTALPEGFAVLEQAVAQDGTTEVVVGTPTGATVVVEHAEGRLDPGTIAQHPSIDLGGHPVVVLSDEPFHGVWQCGDAVMGIVAADRLLAAEVITVLPAAAFDDGALARVVRGWNVVAEAWAP